MEKISYIIVTYNSAATITACLDSLKKLSGEIIVVDNSSEDETVSKIEKYKQVVLIRSKDNLGFSKGCNLGAKQAKGDIFVFLNPDANINSEDFETKIFKNFEDEKIGALGPKFLYPDGSNQKTVRNLPTIVNAFKEYILRIKNSYDFYVPERRSEVEVILGACIVIKTFLFKKIGGFDERFFMYYEDITLCKKVRELGYKVVFDPEIQVEHIMGASGKDKPVSRFLIESAKIYHGLFEFFIIQLILRVGQKVYGRSDH
jgi:N-acetylglucosaminyl-diphospho-decaprenol L-rhamnosyltransferase